jgi:hypothetical protein
MAGIKGDRAHRANPERLHVTAAFAFENLLTDFCSAGGINQISTARARVDLDNCERHEDFQSSCCTGTMCHYRSLCVSIRAFDACSSRSILPIRTHSDI